MGTETAESRLLEIERKLVVMENKFNVSEEIESKLDGVMEAIQSLQDRKSGTSDRFDDVEKYMTKVGNRVSEALKLWKDNLPKQKLIINKSIATDQRIVELEELINAQSKETIDEKVQVEIQDIRNTVKRHYDRLSKRIKTLREATSSSTTDETSLNVKLQLESLENVYSNLSDKVIENEENIQVLYRKTDFMSTEILMIKKSDTPPVVTCKLLSISKSKKIGDAELKATIEGVDNLASIEMAVKIIKALLTQNKE